MKYLSCLVRPVLMIAVFVHAAACESPAKEDAASSQDGAAAEQDCAKAATMTAHALQSASDQAIVEFAKAAELCPEMDEPKYNEAVFLTRANRYAEALTILERITGDRDDSTLLKARILIQLGRDQEAEPMLRHLLEDNKRVEEASLLLSALDTKQGKLPEAIKILLAIPKPEFDNPYVQINLGLLYEKINKIEDANGAMVSIANDPSLSDDLRMEIAQYFVRNGNPSLAAQVLRAVTDPAAKLFLAKVLITTKNYDEADRIVRSLTVSPDQQEIFAILFIVRHQEEQALNTLQAIEKRTGKLSPKLAGLKSYVYLSLGMTERARETAANALADDANVGLANYVLGQALIRLGSRTAGQESIQRAIAIDKRFAEPASNWWDGWF